MSEPKSKNSPAPTPDQLVNSGISATVELSEQDLDGVSGGRTNAWDGSKYAGEKPVSLISAYIKG